jgi:hypothetical protein
LGSSPGIVPCSCTLKRVAKAYTHDGASRTSGHALSTPQVPADGLQTRVVHGAEIALAPQSKVAAHEHPAPPSVHLDHTLHRCRRVRRCEQSEIETVWAAAAAGEFAKRGNDRARVRERRTVEACTRPSPWQSQKPGSLGGMVTEQRLSRLGARGPSDMHCDACLHLRHAATSVSG